MSHFEGLFHLLLFIWSLNNSAAGTGDNIKVSRKYAFSLKIDNLEISFSDKIILKSQIKEGEYESSLFAEIGMNLPYGAGLPQFCEEPEKIEGICVRWDESTFLQIKKVNSFCHEVVWNTTGPAEDCISYGKMNWYGGSEYTTQYWPVEKLKLSYLPFTTVNYDGLCVAEPFWINSKGLFVFVHYGVPLFVDSNNHKNNSLCLISNATSPYNFRNDYRLKYTFCQLDDPRKAREYAIQQHVIGKPSEIPDVRMVKYPIWSTWVKFKKNINETAVLKFAEDIVHHGFNNSQIEIDDNWETCYGSMVFNKTRFSDMKSLSRRLKKLGFRVTIWRHPFVNVNCLNYTVLKQENLFVKNASGFDKVQWWDGTAAVYDFTNTSVKKWFQNKHYEFLEENDIDGFKFDAGESNYIPKNAILHADPNDYPDSLTAAYVNTVAAFGKMTETRVGHMSQQYPIFLRMIDKNSCWDFDNGLPTLITSCLIMNVIGYTWVLPDMVGGNAYGQDISEELFIRWLQVNTFMPVIQLSFAPWDFNNKTIVEIAKKFTSLHYKYSKKIIKLMKKTVLTGAPLNPPIWWIDPKDPVALSIDSEYLLGEDILVAPVLVKGATDRDVYLPKGEWIDGNNESLTYRGPRWLRKYPADLFTLPYFIRINSRNNSHMI